MGYRSQINRALVGNNNGEILNKFNWDLEIDPPSGIYWPGNDFFFNRLKAISGLPIDSATVEEVEVGGGFMVTQTGALERAPVEVTFEFQDYEDSTIGFLCSNWQKAVQDPITRISRRKADIICNMRVYQLTTDLNPIKMWELYAGMITTGDTGDNSFGTKKELSGAVSMNIKFEWWDIKWLNK